MTAPSPRLMVENLQIGGAGFLVVDRVSFTLGPGESLGIAGESGSGKSTLLLSLMGMMRQGLLHVGGSVRLDGRPMLGQSDAALEPVRGGKIALVPQNPATALNPSRRIGAQIDEALQLHSTLTRIDRAARVLDLLGRVRLPEPAIAARRFPHELSGGQVQRAAIAMALAGEPDMLLLDEPTTGLDVTTQAALLDLLVDLRHRDRVGMVCVSHDLGVLARLCDRIAVMYAGAMVEEGPLVPVLTHPGHPYTRALVASIPRIGAAGLPLPIDGNPPSLFHLPTGCRFAPRCALVQDACRTTRPDLELLDPDRKVACLRPMTIPAPVTRPSDAAFAIGAPILAVKDLSVGYAQQNMFGKTTPRQVVEAVSFTVQKGEVLGLVGESGSGKSTILRAIAGLAHPGSGSMSLTRDGETRVLAASSTERSLAQLRSIQLIFQNPDASLNPRHRVLDLLAQPLLLYGKVARSQLRAKAAGLLAEVRLGAATLDRMPAQLSGGERQRVAIARAFAAEPDLLLCDEITTALDVSVQAAVLELIRELARKHDVAAIFVSHDLAVVRAIADRIAVLRSGRIVEIGPAGDLCERPVDDYTQSLIASILRIPA
ncbi:MAG: ABC transporter ATP-binding protein [Rhodobacterales bacterium]|nr:ABC transporter ATP-binding protein [Rhodobacterales bacterium]